MKNSRKVLSILLAFLLVFVSFSTSYAKTFRDTRNHWAKVYISDLSNRGILSGYENNSFKPDANMTKVEFISLINSLAGLKKVYAVTFSDVSSDDWFYEDVGKAIKAGYFTPTTGKFYPNRSITREEALRVIGYIYNLEENPTGATKFADRTNISPSAIGYIGKMVELNIVQGQGDNHFYPKAPVTRAEISKIISLMIEKYRMPGEKVVIDSKIKFGSRNMYD